VVVLLLAILAALALGRYAVPPGDVVALLLGRFGIGPGRTGIAESAWRVVELVRLPRIVVGAFVGAGLVSVANSGIIGWVGLVWRSAPRSWWSMGGPCSA
jgi:ABC-type Fe3+-siderophore transport system permease subunit